MDSKPKFKEEECNLEMLADGMQDSAMECNDNATRNDHNMAIKIEVKEEKEDVTAAEVNQQAQLNSSFFPVLLDNKKEADSDMNDEDNDLPSSEYPRLFTEDDSDTCTSLTHPGIQGNCQTEEATSDFKTSAVYTKNVNKESSMRQHNTNPSQECDDYSKSSQLASDVLDEDKHVIKCEICEKVFKDKSYLKRHMYNHTGVKPFKCASCERSFNLKSNLKRHIMVHSGIKPYKCSSCEKSFTQNTLLQTHMLWHSGTKPYSCDICNKTFIRKSNLYVHTLRHSGINPYQCGLCGKSFARKQYLKKHNLHHSHTKPHKCDKCGKGFNQKSHLKEHSLCHSREKAYKCNNCDKSYKRKSSLVAHSLLHKGRKPHKCDICQKSFVQKTHLQRHRVRHLSTQPTISQL